MKWLEALKAWNASRGGRYTVPRKGTPEHAEVKEMMEGGSKASGYVRLMYAKAVNKRTPDSYSPPARKKVSDSKWRPEKIRQPGDTLIEEYGTTKQKRAMAVRKGRVYKGPKEEEAPAPPPAPSSVSFPSQEAFKKMSQRERFTIMNRGTKEKSAGRSIPPWLETAIKKSDALIARKTKGFVDMRKFFKPKTGGAKKAKTRTTKGYSASQAAADMKALGVKQKKKDDKKPAVKEEGQVAMMMRIGNHVMVAEPQPATIKVKGDMSTLKMDDYAPTSGYTGFENRPKETTAAQAGRKFSAEETRVQPLSELFMRKPARGLVEEQMQGKGCWWKRDLEEF